MQDEEIRQFMAQLLAKLSNIEDKVTRLYDQTPDAMWERIREDEKKRPPRVLTEEEHHQRELQRFRNEIPYSY